METYFVLVCWNNKDLIDECIDSIKQQTTKDFSIIVVDNGSTDGSVNHIKKNHKDVILIDTGKNNGFAIGNNTGIKRALSDPKCRYIALLNTDATLDKNWLKILTSFAKTHPKAASLQTPTLDYYNHDVLDSRGIKIDFAGRAIQLGYREPNTKDYKSHQVFGVNAAACIYSADFLRSQPFGEDYFDSNLWMYLEDVDLAARAVILGYENWVVKGSYAYHMGSVSSSKNPGFAVFHIYRNNLPMLVKNLPKRTLLRILPGVFITDTILILGMLRHRDLGTTKVIVKARLISFRMMKRFLKKRKILLASSKLDVSRLNDLISAK